MGTPPPDLERERVRNVFTRLLPEPIAAEMLARSDGQPSIGAVRLWATVMFVDLVGSTALSSQLDPEDMRELIRTYQNTVAGEITRFERLGQSADSPLDPGIGGSSDGNHPRNGRTSQWD